jgi:hypothetical protein
VALFIPIIEGTNPTIEFQAKKIRPEEFPQSGNHLAHHTLDCLRDLLNDVAHNISHEANEEGFK